MKNVIKQLTPPLLLDIVKGWLFLSNKYQGVFDNWQHARKQCTGYDNEEVFNKVTRAAMQVKRREAVCERDSVLFDRAQYAWASLSCLMYVAAVNRGELKVLDFGGGLGSTYFTIRRFLHNLNVEWSIIEQSHFVNFGQKNISDECLHFYDSIADFQLQRKPNIIFLSSVLQYLEKPYIWLENLIRIDDCDFILIDRMPFSKTSKEFIQIQKVPANIYKASYPLHILNEDTLIHFMNKHNFHLFEKFDQTSFCETKHFYPQGLFFQRLK